LYATYAIIGINVIVFILMVINGAEFLAPNALVHIDWGSNYSPLTLSEIGGGCSLVFLFTLALFTLQ
jgi:hypothetical protein